MYEKELLAVLLAIKKWLFYLIDRHSIHHQNGPPKSIGAASDATLQHTWLTKLLGYDYEIVYKNGADNARLRVQNVELFDLILSSIESGLLERIKQSWTSDVQCVRLINQ